MNPSLLGRVNRNRSILLRLRAAWLYFWEGDAAEAAPLYRLLCSILVVLVLVAAICLFLVFLNWILSVGLFPILGLLFVVLVLVIYMILSSHPPKADKK